LKKADFGDSFFEREASDKERTYKTKQYIHIPSIDGVRKQLEKAGFKIPEINEEFQISKKRYQKIPTGFQCLPEIILSQL
jgi:hypothetical protein